MSISYHPIGPPIPIQPYVTIDLLSVCLFWAFPMNRIVPYVVFCDWLLSLSLLFSRVTHVIACVSVSFFFMANIYFIIDNCLVSVGNYL